MVSSHLGKPLTLRNLRKCIVNKLFASFASLDCLFGNDGHAERPNDYEGAASLVWDTQLAIKDNMLHLMRQQSNTWIAHLEELGNDEEPFFRNSHISLEMLNRITLMDGAALELLEKPFGLLQVNDATPLSLFQQHEAQEHLFPTKSSTSLEAGDVASSFEWRRQSSLYKRTG